VAQHRNDDGNVATIARPEARSSDRHELRTEARRSASRAAREAYDRVINETSGILPRSASNRPLTRLM
jgi:hypothetical protein